MAEPSFPRGGRKQSKYKRKESLSEDEEDNVNKTRKMKREEKQRKKLKMLKAEEEAEKPETVELPSFGRKIVLPNFDMLYEGMVILGCIESISDYKLDVSLPGGLVGHVDLAHVSDHYTKQLKAYAQGKSEDIATLHDIFEYGEIVCCKILSLAEDSRGHKKISLTLNPHDVNGGIKNSQLCEGIVVPATVTSAEEYGYAMEIGLKQVRCFMKQSDAQTFINQKNKGKELQEGRVVLCRLKKVASAESGDTMIGLTANLQEVVKPVPEDFTGDPLLPGTVVSARVTQILEDGLVVRIFGRIGKVPLVHLKKAQHTVADHKVGEIVTGRILYIESPLDLITLSLNWRILHSNPPVPFARLKNFQVAEKAVITIISRKGVTVKLEKNVRGFCHKNELSDEEEAFGGNFPLGSSHKCRILKLHHMDELAIVSLRESLLKKNIYNFKDIEVGRVMEAKIASFTESGGIRLELGQKVHGLVTNIHTADYPIKHPEKKYKVGEEIKCRVLSVNSHSHHIELTLKKSLINSDYPIQTEYVSDSKPVTDGFVGQVFPYGLLMVFYNNVKGMIRFPEEQSTANNDYYVGQVVRCKVTKCIPEKQKMFVEHADSKIKV